MKTKTCSKCKRSKSLDEFYPHSRSVDRLMSHCKECQKSYATAWAKRNSAKVVGYVKAWRQANPDKVSALARRSRIKQRCGLTVEEYEAKVRKAKCEICKRKLKKPCMDHQHTTGVFRGFLCRTCNIGLGYFQDSADLLRRAASYLEIIRG